MAERERCVFCRREKAIDADWDRNGELNDEQAAAAGLDDLCWEQEDESCLALLADSDRPTNLEAALEALDRLDHPHSKPQGEGELCDGAGTISRPTEAYCDCIMTAHCQGKGGKDGKLCRLRRFGSGTEGSPGVAGPPPITKPCPGCSRCQPPEQQDEGREELEPWEKEAVRELEKDLVKRLHRCERALREIGDAVKAQDADSLEWATWAHDLARTALEGEGRE